MNSSSSGTQNNQTAKPTRLNPGDEAMPGAPGTGEDLCLECNGTGKKEGGAKCPACNGTGRVVRAIGGG
nr:hypothetical protein [Noviherbaspirillum massiliense]